METTKRLIYNGTKIAYGTTFSKLIKPDYVFAYNVKFDLFNCQMGYLLRQGLYFLDYINKIITVTYESGLICKWFKLDVENKYESSNKDLVVLSQRHLEGSFLIYLCGCGIAKLIFIVEVLLKECEDE